ncbi:iron-containing redox enzyme family protein [Parafrigoribacterium soli]|uniref:iron-containing redox enzyme family protein n=1 Tax=Parafrigoribacterium soli TaxID=3144663 RepID=UPI0032EB124C
MKAPEARGPISSLLLRSVSQRPDTAGSTVDGDLANALAQTRAALNATGELLFDDDLQLTLLCLYELHYLGIDGVDEAWEWHPMLLTMRTEIESRFERVLRDRVAVPERPPVTADAVAETLFALTAEDAGPSLSRFVAQKATREQLAEFLIQRSIYQLKEADPHSWAIPRLTGRAKAALVEIQADEYGGGDPGRMHSVIFGITMRGLDLDDSYGAYIDDVPAITLASVNMMSMFGLHRRLRGAIAGHLAAFEMTSSIPNRLYGNGFRRLGFDSEVTWYFDEHVEADAVHEQIAARDLAGGLAEAEPTLLDDILFGASACLTVDGMVGAQMLDAWANGRSSLRIRQHTLV